MKTCTKCKIEKELSCFNNRKNVKDGLRSNCKECQKQTKTKWDQTNKEYSTLYNKEYRENNKEYRYEQTRQWCQENKEHRSEYKRQYDKDRKKVDPAYKLRCNISSTINSVLKRSKTDKGGKSISKYLGYTMKELKEHLEKQFDSSMSWDNHGSYWHMDHIHPQSKLPYTSMEDENFKKAWSLDNLRPLEKIANIKKGNKIL